MSLTNTLQVLTTKLASLTPPGTQSSLARVFPDPPEQISQADFPCAVLCLAPGQAHAITAESLGSGRHDYTVLIYLFLGVRSTNLAEIHARMLDWQRAVADALYADQRLGGAVLFIGNPASNQLFTWQYGVYEWAKAQLWGIRFTLPITEAYSETMG